MKDSCSEGRKTTDTHKPETELDRPAAVVSRAFDMSPAVAEDGQALQASHFDSFVVGGVHATTRSEGDPSKQLRGRTLDLTMYNNAKVINESRASSS